MEQRIAGSMVGHGPRRDGVGGELDRPVPTRRRPRILVAIRDVRFHQEVLDHLAREPRIEIASAVDDRAPLQHASASLDLDAIAVCPELARETHHPSVRARASSIVMVAQEMTVSLLREAIDLGVRAVVSWPDERQELSDILVTTRADDPFDEGARGRVIAVLGARGGAGTTFVASQLAASIGDAGARCAIVDLDCAYSGLTVALGVQADHEVRTIADLVSVAEELAPDHLEGVLFRHSRNFAALLAPPAPDMSADISSGLVRASIALLAATHDVVVLHVPRAMDHVALAGLRMADESILITTQDLFSLYGAKRAMWQLDLDSRCRVVVNRFARGQLVPADIARALGAPPWAVVRFDPSVRRAQDLGRLLGPKSRRAGRDVRWLARNLMSAGVGSPEGRAVRGRQPNHDRGA